MFKPIRWLLDVDGVLNASKAGWSAAPSKGDAFALGTAWKMRWAPALMSRIRQVHNTGSVEILWATSWVGHTDQLEKLFKLPHLISAGLTAMSVVDKQAAAEEAVDLGFKLIWTDDVAIPESSALRFKLDAADACLIAPKPNRGLRPEDLDIIDAYVVKYGS